jgi:hypothetical protein
MGRLYAVQFITNTGSSSPLYGSSDSKIGEAFAFDTNGTDQILRIQCVKAGAIDAVNAIPANVRSGHFDVQFVRYIFIFSLAEIGAFVHQITRVASKDNIFANINAGCRFGCCSFTLGL